MAQKYILMYGLAILCISKMTKGHVLDGPGEEPTCMSRFDYDFKMLKTMVDITKENEELQETVAALTSRVDQLTSAVQRPPDVAFYAYLSQSLSDMGNHEIIKFDHVKTNVGGAYDPDCGKFEAPEAGMYAFHWVHTNHDRTWMTTELYSNGHIYGKAVSDSGNHNDRSAGSNFVILKLDKGDRVWIRSSDSWHNGKVLGDYLSTFSGYRLF